MSPTNWDLLSKIINEFRLATLPCGADLSVLAQSWGVSSIEELDIDLDAMLVPHDDSYIVVLKKVEQPFQFRRQKFSFAHELGHLLLQRSQNAGVAMKYRGHGYSNEEERLCDQLAAEILMPRMAFYEDGWMEGWSLKSLRALAGTYDTSIPATAVRMVDLMPEEALMGVWKVSEEGKPTLQWPHSGKTTYAIPSPSIVADERLELVSRAWNSLNIEEGTAPVRQGRRAPINVPAEAMSWGRDEYKQVMVFYYPTRHTSSPV